MVMERRKRREVTRGRRKSRKDLYPRKEGIYYLGMRRMDEEWRL